MKLPDIQHRVPVPAQQTDSPRVGDEIRAIHATVKAVGEVAGVVTDELERQVEAQSTADSINASVDMQTAQTEALKEAYENYAKNSKAVPADYIKDANSRIQSAHDDITSSLSTRTRRKVATTQAALKVSAHKAMVKNISAVTETKTVKSALSVSEKLKGKILADGDIDVDDSMELIKKITDTIVDPAKRQTLYDSIYGEYQTAHYEGRINRGDFEQVITDIDNNKGIDKIDNVDSIRDEAVRAKTVRTTANTIALNNGINEMTAKIKNGGDVTQIEFNRVVGEAEDAVTNPITTTAQKEAIKVNKANLIATAEGMGHISKAQTVTNYAGITALREKLLAYRDSDTATFRARQGVYTEAMGLLLAREKKLRKDFKIEKVGGLKKDVEQYLNALKEGADFDPLDTRDLINEFNSISGSDLVDEEDAELMQNYGETLYQLEFLMKGKTNFDDAIRDEIAARQAGLEVFAMNKDVTTSASSVAKALYGNNNSTIAEIEAAPATAAVKYDTTTARALVQLEGGVEQLGEALGAGYGIADAMANVSNLMKDYVGANHAWQSNMGVYDVNKNLLPEDSKFMQTFTSMLVDGSNAQQVYALSQIDMFTGTTYFPAIIRQMGVNNKAVTGALAMVGNGRTATADAILRGIKTTQTGKSSKQRMVQDLSTADRTIATAIGFSGANDTYIDTIWAHYKATVAPDTLLSGDIDSDSLKASMLAIVGEPINLKDRGAETLRPTISFIRAKGEPPVTSDEFNNILRFNSAETIRRASNKGGFTDGYMYVGGTRVDIHKVLKVANMQAIHEGRYILTLDNSAATELGVISGTVGDGEGSHYELNMMDLYVPEAGEEAMRGVAEAEKFMGITPFRMFRGSLAKEQYTEEIQKAVRKQQDANRLNSQLKTGG